MFNCWWTAIQCMCWVLGVPCAALGVLLYSLWVLQGVWTPSKELLPSAKQNLVSCVVIQPVCH